MKSHKEITRSGRARYSQLKKHVKHISNVINEKGAIDISDDDMCELRELTGKLSQCFHEFNAVRNLLDWNDKDRFPEQFGMTANEFNNVCKEIAKAIDR